MTGDCSRRTVLATVGTAGAALLAGCGIIVGGDPDVVVTNERDEELTADVTLVDDETLLAERPTIPRGDEFAADDILPSSGTVELVVAVDGGPSDEHEFDVRDETSVQAHVDEGIEFERSV